MPKKRPENLIKFWSFKRACALHDCSNNVALAVLISILWSWNTSCKMVVVGDLYSSSVDLNKQSLMSTHCTLPWRQKTMFLLSWWVKLICLLKILTVLRSSLLLLSQPKLRHQSDCFCTLLGRDFSGCSGVYSCLLHVAAPPSAQFPGLD